MWVQICLYFIGLEPFLNLSAYFLSFYSKICVHFISSVDIFSHFRLVKYFKFCFLIFIQTTLWYISYNFFHIFHATYSFISFSAFYFCSYFNYSFLIFQLQCLLSCGFFIRIHIILHKYVYIMYSFFFQTKRSLGGEKFWIN